MFFDGPFNPLFSITGFCVGMLVGITGVGGASLMTPLLVLMFGVHPAMAVGTDLLYAAITKTAGAAVHHRHGKINWQMTGLLALGSIPAALITLWLMSGMDRTDMNAVSTLTSALGWMLLLTAAILIFRGAIMSAKTRWVKTHSLPSSRAIASYTVLLGLVLGFVVTMTSVGAGAIGVTMLLLLYPRTAIQEIVGSDIAHAIPLTFVGGIGYWLIGEIDWFMLLALLVGSIPGIILGSFLAPRMPERLVRIILAITLAIVGAKLITS